MVVSNLIKMLVLGDGGGAVPGIVGRGVGGGNETINNPISYIGYGSFPIR